MAKPKSRMGEMDYNGFAGWATGELILSIGRGDFDTTVHFILQSAMTWRKARTKFLAERALAVEEKRKARKKAETEKA